MNLETGLQPGGASARQLAAALDRLAAGVAVLDAAGRVVHVNAALVRLLGADAPAVVAAFREGLLHLGDGRAVQARRVPLPGGTAVVVPPLEGDAPFLRSVLDAIDTSLVVYDADDRYLFGNRAYHERYPHLPADEELKGRTFEHMLRRSLAAGSFADQQAKDDPEAFVARRVAEFRSGQPELSERMTLAGRWELIRTRVTPSGCRISIRTTITAIKHVQEELRLAKERLESEAEARIAFVAGLGHELRTPLAAVQGYAEMIEHEVLGPLETPKYRECAALIHHSGRHLLDLVLELPERGADGPRRPGIREETIDLAELMRRQATMVQPLAREKATQLVLNMPEHPPRLRGDARMVRQMLLNLLSNAVRFTERGSVTVTLRRREDGGIDLDVSDTGVGMAPDVVARLGEPYFRGAAAAAAQVPGTGLGLGVVQDLLTLHQGRLAVASVPGQGTSVVLQFPPGRTVAPAP
ncbi:MAG: PAS-domain containing protein [Alphaproteobacteria bacterium]|nr:PAS-domain containing protein [Alphaproteobacteria bacterium]